MQIYISRLSELNHLFSLTPHGDHEPPTVSPKFHESSLAFLAGVMAPKSELLRRVITEEGWPDSSKEGLVAEAVAFKVALHADYDIDLQKQCHALMVESAAKGTTPLGFVAFITDRILCNEGHHQRFGTQIRELENGCFVPKAIEDVELVDSLREQVQLAENLSDYLQRVNNGDLLLYRLILDGKGEAAEPQWAMPEKKPISDENNVIPFPTKH